MQVAPKQINILGISGSLKSTSTNTNILKFISTIVPVHVSLKLFGSLDSLPHFNPETTETIPAVENLRQQIKEADAVVVSTPEYAFGMPGVLKNALDWIVSSGELNEKPVAASSASPLYTGGDKALGSLLLTLTALGTNMGAGSSLSIANVKSKITDAGEISDDETTTALMLMLNELINKIKFKS
ncbi:NADPH-dependent FMN reductase [soil metagenome]